MHSRKLTISAMFISLGVILGNLIYIPVGIAKCFPIQHAINILSAIFLGPGFSITIAFLISLLRNLTGTGSLLAFPGSMIGALLAGLAYKKFKNKYFAVSGEIIGTGLIGGLLAFPISKYILGNEVIAVFFIYPFLLSTIGGSLLALFILKMTDFIKIK